MASSRTKAGYAKSAYPIVKLKNKMLIFFCVCVLFQLATNSPVVCDNYFYDGFNFIFFYDLN